MGNSTLKDVQFIMSSSPSQPFPLSKLVYMFVKTLAAPVARRVQLKAATDQKVKKWVCLAPANLYHYYEVKIKFRVMNIGKVRMAKVPKMNEREALTLGSNLFSEFLIYFVASVIAFNEWRKYKDREKVVETSLTEEQTEMEECMEQLKAIVDEQNH